MWSSRVKEWVLVRKLLNVLFEKIIQIFSRRTRRQLSESRVNENLFREFPTSFLRAMEKKCVNFVRGITYLVPAVSSSFGSLLLPHFTTVKQLNKIVINKTFSPLNST